MGAFVRRLHALFDCLPLIWLAWSLPFGLAVAWITPPWQVPDEPAHFLRMMDVSFGGMIGARNPAGGEGLGTIDPAAVPAFLTFADLPFHAERKDTLSLETKGRDGRWSGQKQSFGLVNTSVYPPVFYAPGALSMVATRARVADFVDSLLCARGINLVLGCVMIAIGLALARRIRLALLACAVLPMNIFMMASANQDALLIAALMMAAGWCDGVGARGEAAKRWELVVLAVLLACAGMARPTHLFLLGLLPLAWTRRREALVAAALAACGVLAWIVACLPIMPTHPGASVVEQCRFLAGHVADLPGLLARTWQQNHTFYWFSFVGILGWLDTFLPRWFYLAVPLPLGLAFLSASSRRGRRPAVALAAVLLGVAATFVIEYLTWSPVGNPVIEGVQGRYLLPFAPVLALAVPACPAIGRRIVPWAVAAVLALMLVVPAVTLRTLMLRYYLG
jgi:uncharacterized membrane protein